MQSCPEVVTDSAGALAGIEARLGSDSTDRPTLPSERRRLLPRGTVIGGEFEVRDLIGEGGMGQVYEVHDRLLNRRVALKVGWPHLPSTVLAEAQAMAAVRHPSIVAIHSVGRHSEMYYVVMELIHGPSLEEYMRRQRSSGKLFPVAEVVDLLVAISESLSAVHAAGMAHRDVKPPNILLAPGNRVVLSDFGISQPEICASNSLDPAGSPHYMAPETISRSVRPGEGHLVDTYALGVVAFELLTDELPFPADNVRRVFLMHLTEKPPSAGDLRPEIPPRLSELIDELLAKDPRARPQSMEEIYMETPALAPPRAGLGAAMTAATSMAVGVDLVQISQIADSMSRFGSRFLERVYTPEELAYCLSNTGSSASRLAARFAAKEAARKVLRVGDAPLTWTSIEVRRTPHGWCELAVYDDAASLACKHGFVGFSLCLSHEGDYATAVVIAERAQERAQHAR